MKDNKEDDLMRSIKNLFEDYEQDYVDGSWEKFTAKDKNGKIRPLWISLAKIAAVFALIMHLFPLPVDDIRQQGKKSAGNKSDYVIPYTSRKVNPTINNEQGTTVKEYAGTFPNIPSPATPDIPVQVKPMILSQDTAAIKSTSIALNNSRDSQRPFSTRTENRTARTDAIQPDTASVVKKSSIDRLFTLKENPVEQKEKKAEKWELGLAVASGMGSSKVNVSTGLNTQFNISSKIALSSGVAYVAMNGEAKSTANNASASTDVLRNRKLVSTEANLQAIDIPLNVVYKVNKHFYTSAGVSTFTVLQEKRKKDYLTAMPTASSSVVGGNDQYASQMMFTEVKASQATSEQFYKGNSYIGFMNFSAGRTQEIFGKQKIQIEPYLKLPLGKLSDGDLKLTTGGLRLIWGF